VDVFIGTQCICGRAVLCAEFFEEMMSLVFNLTSERISERMWQTLPLLYDLFNKDNSDYFTGLCT